MKLGEEDAYPGAAAADEKEEQVHHRAGHPCGGKGAVAYHTAHDHGVHRVVKLLHDVSGQKGQGQGDELAPDRTLGQIGGGRHGRTSLGLVVPV